VYCARVNASNQLKQTTEPCIPVQPARRSVAASVSSTCGVSISSVRKPTADKSTVRITGKLHGMTPAQLRRLESIRDNHEIAKASNLDALASFTQQFISHARDLARSGQKDAARNWLRFFVNSRIAEIISVHDARAGAAIKSGLNSLRGEVHPQDVAVWETDIQHIRDSLTEILNHLTSGKHVEASPLGAGYPALEAPRWSLTSHKI